MTKKRFIIIGDSNMEFIMQTELFLPIYDTGKRLSLKNCCDLLNELNDENKELKGLIDLFAQDICDLTELLCKNNIDYKLHSDVTNFITKWGIRID